jgi:isopenicillin-N N-acyltransferase-like protein
MSIRAFRSGHLPPGDRGRELGRRFHGEIAATVAAYQGIFDRAAGRPVDLEHWGTLAVEQVQLISPALAEEIDGIASGAGLPVTSIAAINARTEVLAAVGPCAAHECSTVVQVSDDGPPLAVQTWDWYPDLAPLWFVWQVPHSDGRMTTTLTEFGIVGKIGVNRSGLAVLFNILHHERDGDCIGAPVHVLARCVLDEATDLNSALLRLSTAQISGSSALTVVGYGGTESAAVTVELNPAGPGYATPDDQGLLLHTNHFLSTPAAHHDTELRTGPDTVVRLCGLRRRLRGRTGLTVGDAVAALDSHLLGGGATCCHPDPNLPAAARFQTLATVALDLESGTLRAHAGGPCTYDSDTTTSENDITHRETQMLKLQRIDNMDILTHDVARLVDFYHRVLGLPFHLPYEPEEDWAAIDFGNLTLYIFKSEVGEHAPRRTAVNPENAPGIDSFAFEVADLDEAEAALDANVEWVDERIEWKHPNGTWYRYRPFYDPDGNMLYITEPHPVAV